MITTHILDTHQGRPAEGVVVVLERREHSNWKEVGSGKTNADGRVADLMPEGQTGIYRLTFATAEYFKNQKMKTFYPSVSICFEVASPKEHYHVPLLLSGHGYSTYRGS